jgi:hypothetical protein
LGEVQGLFGGGEGVLKDIWDVWWSVVIEACRIRESIDVNSLLNGLAKVIDTK